MSNTHRKTAMKRHLFRKRRTQLVRVRPNYIYTVLWFYATAVGKPISLVPASVVQSSVYLEKII